jgi:cytochrome c oxidase cbb3-type subunit 3
VEPSEADASALERRHGTGVMIAGRRSILLVLVLIAGAVSAGLVYGAIRTHRVERQLLLLPPDEILSHTELVAFATERGPYLFVDHCASCHGNDMRGDGTRGIPDLQDSVWLYGEGRISEIENTIQYGIRSSHPKAHNITDMPAFLHIGQLSPAEISDVVEYVLGLNGKPHDDAAARRGSDLYQNKGNCFDCHSSDALGNPDYGAPALAGAVWMYGGTREALTRSVSNGRHGLCPAWIDELDAADVRELAVYLYQVSHRTAATRTRG